MAINHVYIIIPVNEALKFPVFKLVKEAAEAVQLFDAYQDDK